MSFSKADTEALRDAIQVLLFFSSRPPKSMNERKEIEAAMQTIDRLATAAIRVPGEDSELWSFRLRRAAWEVCRYATEHAGEPPLEELRHIRECQDTLRNIPTGDADQIAATESEKAGGAGRPSNQAGTGQREGGADGASSARVNPSRCPGCKTVVPEEYNTLPLIPCLACGRWELHTGVIVMPVAGPPGTPPEVVQLYSPFWQPKLPNRLENDSDNSDNKATRGPATARQAEGEPALFGKIRAHRPDLADLTEDETFQLAAWLKHHPPRVSFARMQQQARLDPSQREPDPQEAWDAYVGAVLDYNRAKYARKAAGDKGAPLVSAGPAEPGQGARIGTGPDPLASGAPGETASDPRLRHPRIVLVMDHKEHWFEFDLNECESYGRAGLESAPRDVHYRPRDGHWFVIDPTSGKGHSQHPDQVRQLFREACRPLPSHPSFPPTTTSTTTTTTTTPDPHDELDSLGRLQLEALEALYLLQAFSKDQRRPSSEVADKAAGRGADPDAFKDAVTDLKDHGLAQTQIGRGGGSWLTSLGREAAERLQKRRKKADGR